MKFKNDIEKFEFFELFQKNEVSQNERTRFEEELKNNSQFAAEFEEYKHISELVIDNSILNLKDELVTIHKKFDGSTPSSYGKGRGFSNTNLTLLIVAGISIIIGLLLFVKPKKENLVIDNSATTMEKHEIVEPSKEIEEFVEPEQEKDNVIKTQNKINSEDATKIENETSIPQMANPDLQIARDNRQDSSIVKENKKLNQNQPVKKVLPSVSLPDNSLANNTQEREDTPEVDNPVDCEKVKISCKYNVVESCIEYVSGEIIVDKRSINGGTPPYQISINGGNDYYESRFAFRKLNAGTYNLLVKDKNLCEKKIARIEIEEKICITDYKYSPVFGEVWTIPVEKNKKGVFKLFNKNGQILVKKEINEYSDKTWDGKDNNGNPVKMDYYPFVIQYSDGEIFKGSVTLLK